MLHVLRRPNNCLDQLCIENSLKKQNMEVLLLLEVSMYTTL